MLGVFRVLATTFVNVIVIQTQPTFDFVGDRLVAPEPGQIHAEVLVGPLGKTSSLTSSSVSRWCVERPMHAVDDQRVRRHPLLLEPVGEKHRLRDGRGGSALLTITYPNSSPRKASDTLTPRAAESRRTNR